MLKQKPEIGDTLVCRNGERFTCCAVKDLREVQQHWAQKYLDESGGYLGLYGSDKWMHWTPMLCSRTTNPEWDIIEIIPAKRHFSPQIGDTIVTAERGNYTCSEILSNGGFYGKRDNYNWQNWDKNGATPGNAYPEIQDAYRVVEIIPANPVQPKETDLEARVRVLEKENAMLVRLLMKEGKL